MFVQTIEAHPMLQAYDDAWPIVVMIRMNCQFRKSGMSCGIAGKHAAPVSI